MEFTGSTASARLRNLLLLLFVAALPFALASSPLIFDDGDVSWHLAAGQWILAQGRIPVADPFSFTMLGQPWVAHEWLAEVILAAGFRIAGYGGVAALVFLALATTNLIVFRAAARTGSAVPGFLLLAGVLLVLFPFTLARPHVLVWPLLAGWAFVLLKSRDEGRAPPLPFVAMMLVWTNLHGSFPLGLVILGCVMLDVLVSAGWRSALFVRWMLFGIAAAVATSLNANGPPGLMHPFTIMGMETAGEIAEWRPSDPMRTPAFFAFLVLAAVVLVTRRSRLTAGEGLLLAALTIMAMLQVRHQSWLVILSALILARNLEPGAENAAEPGRPAVIAVGLLTVALIRAALPIGPAPNVSNPQWLAEHVPAELRGKPVLNDYSMGGPLILSGIRPFIDGRADMYGDHFFADYIALSRGDAGRFEAAVRRYDIQWTVFPPHKPINRLLERSPDWHRAYGDAVAVIYVRAAGTEPPATRRIEASTGRAGADVR